MRDIGHAGRVYQNLAYKGETHYLEVGVGGGLMEAEAQKKEGWDEEVRSSGRGGGVGRGPGKFPIFFFFSNRSAPGPGRHDDFSSSRASRRLAHAFIPPTIDSRKRARFPASFSTPKVVLNQPS